MIDFSIKSADVDGMAEIINLRVARKTRARKAATEQAAANRVAFGRTRAERAADAAAQSRRDALLDGAALPPDRTAE